MKTTVIQNNLLFVFICFCVTANAKFTTLCSGTARAGLATCLLDPAYNFTRETITLKENARLGFECIMKNIPNNGQAILSSGSSITALIPTAITFFGNRRVDVLTVHSKLPFLAFLLCFTGIRASSRSWTAAKMVDAGRTQAKLQQKFSDRILDMFCPEELCDHWVSLIVVHILALGAVAVVLWQTYTLSQCAVVSWSCWTSFYPFIWIAYGPVAHLGYITVLKIIYKYPKLELGRILLPVIDTFFKVQFLMGTAILGSLTLISGRDAITVLVTYAGVAIIMRECVGWILETMRGIISQ